MRARIALAIVLLATAGCGEPAVPSSPAAPTPDGDALEGLDQLAWWTTESLGFGIIPEAPPDPDPATQPGSFRQLSIGTLDGRITAVRALHDQWSHSCVSGPYGTDVLVANDTGTTSEVFIVSALDGSRTDLLQTDDVVAAAAIGEGGGALYTVEVDRVTGTDSGLTRRPIGGGDAETILPGPLSDGPSEVPVYWITADPLDGIVVAQWCHGQVSCLSWAVHLDSGRVLTETDVGWPQATGSDLFIADGLGGSEDAWGWNLRSGDLQSLPNAGRSVPVMVGGSWFFVRDDRELPFGPTMLVDPRGEEHQVPGVDEPGSSIGTRGHDRGTALPPGWVMRFGEPRFHTIPDFPAPPARAQLIQAGTGVRVDVERPELVVREGADCEILPPARMPDGTAVGTGVIELLDGVRSVRWGPPQASVILAVGWSPEPDPIAPTVPVVVRGQPGVVAIGPVEDARPVITWTEGGCEYAAWLPPGTEPDAAVEFAVAY